MNRTAFLTAVMAAALVRPAMAADLTIGSKTTTPVSTSNASNGAGNITIATGGSVEIATKGAAAVTLDSDNAVVNNGTIANTGGNTSTGVHILAGHTGSLLNAGTINIPGTAVDTATGELGILLDGIGSFTGDITTAGTSSITVSGLNAQGVTVRADLAGNLTLGGTINATGTNAHGVFATATLQGAFVNNGSISITSGGTSTSTINANPGTGVALGGNIGGGILNAASGHIDLKGGATAMLVAPSIGGNLGNISIGVLADSTNPGYSLINRGSITATGDQPSVSPIGLEVGNGPGDGSGIKTVLAGGILNAGTISTSARSDNKNATSMTTAPSSATTVIVGVGAVVPVFDNAASGTITSAISGPSGGTSNAVLIASGAALTTFNNAGTISSTATSTDLTIPGLSAEALYDASGGLTTITNSGTISATATRLNSNTQTATAVYMGLSSVPVTLTNTGTIVGDVVFGSAAANQLTIEGPQASVTGHVLTSGNGRVNIAVSPGGTGGSLVTNGAINAGTLTVGAGGTVDLGIGATNGISATGNASFDAASHLRVTPLSLLPSDANITLVHSDTGLSFGNFSATTANIQIPFLFTGNLSVDANDLVLSLHRKTADELGLTGDTARLYGPAMRAATADSDLGAALSLLDSARAVKSAINQMSPVTDTAARAVVDALTNPSTNALASRQQTLALTPGIEGGVAPWAQFLYNRFDDTSSAAYTGHGFGLTAGVDYSEAGKGHFGIAFTVYKGDTDEESGRTVSNDAQWFMVSPYMGFRQGNAFINAQINAGVGKQSMERTLRIGSVKRTAESNMTELLAGGGITGGYVLNLGSIRIVPQVNLNAFDLIQNNYTEQGGGNGIDLAVKERSLPSVRVLAGAAAGGYYEAFGGHLVPQVFGGWSNELLNASNRIDAAFDGIANSGFKMSGPGVDRSKMIGSGSLAYMGSNWTVGISYDADIASKTHIQTARLTVAGRF